MYEESGLKVDDYCAQHGLSGNAYFYWLRKVKEAALTQSGFVEVQQQAELSSCYPSPKLTASVNEVVLGIDGLIAVVNAEFKLDPTESNYIFLFCGRTGDRIKALLYEGDGWLLCYKRFTDGKLQWPRSTSEARTLTPQQYRWLM